MTNHRKDIDGLRCLAILAVLIFHAFPNHMPGGFVGVDVFFVISGFLISGIISRELKAGNFSFAVFYARRFRRLLPALLLVIIATWIAGLFLFLPDEMADLGKHMMGAASFILNLVLWKEAGYFDKLADTKPFLHLWSLGVEEQFYLIWPLTLFLCFRQKKVSPLIPIAALLVLSLGLNLDQIRFDAPAVFFGMTTRLWQFSFGAMLALNNSKRSVLSRSNKFIIEGLALTGFLAIIIPCFKFSQSLPYPGYWAIIPTLGTTLLIWVGQKSFLIKILLENPIAVFIGLISYPLYLWHWPMISILHITEGSALSNVLIWTALTLSFILAILTYKFLERPIQKALTFKNPKTVARTIKLSLILLTITFLIGGVTYKTNGFPDRLSKSGFNKISFKDPYRVLTKNTKGFFCPQELNRDGFIFCRQNKTIPPTVAVWGDSLSLAVQTGLEAHNLSSLLLSQGACPTLVDTKAVREGQGDTCGTSNRAILNYLVKTKSIKTVVLVSLGADYTKNVRRGKPWDMTLIYKNTLEKNPARVYETSLRETLRELLRANKQVVIYETHPELPLDIASLNDCEGFRHFRFSNSSRPNCDINFNEFAGFQKDYWNTLDKFKKEFPSLIVFRAYELVCDQHLCKPFLNGNALYTDTEHLSVDGGNIVTEKLISEIK